MHVCTLVKPGETVRLWMLFSSPAEHRRAVEKLIEERRQQFQQQKDQELEERREEERRQAMRHAIIEQERQRLLREHASKLLGYLPKVQYMYMFVPQW